MDHPVKDEDVDMKEPVSSSVKILEGELDDAANLEDSNVDEAIRRYTSIINKDLNAGEESVTKIKEEAIYRLAKLYASKQRTNELKQLFVDIRPFFAAIPKARTAKIVRTLIGLIAKSSNSIPLQVEIVQDGIAWCVREKRSFLKQRLQCNLASLFLKLERFKEALAVISGVLREVKKLDDKLLLVEIHLIESRVHLALQNLPKSKASLTAARANANAIYCPPNLQAQIDLQSGTLCAMENDYKTGFSYFYEAFEGYNTISKPAKAVRCLKYMLLSKIMTNQSEDVYSIINGKAGIKYAGIEIEAMKAVADAHKQRDIHTFEAVFLKYKAQLADDPTISYHLTDLKNNLLEQNLLRLIEPFGRVQIAHVAKLIELPMPQIQAKLSEMILDQKLAGILDQGSGDLIVFDPTDSDKTYANSLDTLKELSGVVDRLYTKAKRISK